MNKTNIDRFDRNRYLYEIYKINPDYYDVEFDEASGGMKATHKDHCFDPDKGIYEEEVQNIGFNNGYSVILTSEKGKGIGENYTEGLWNNKQFEIATCENANTNNNNIVKGLKHCASKDGNEVAILYFYKGKYIKNDVKRAIGRYDGLKEHIASYKKFKEIYVLCEEKVYQLR